jgi:hypothetical protein
MKNTKAESQIVGKLFKLATSPCKSIAATTQFFLKRRIAFSSSALHGSHAGGSK